MDETRTIGEAPLAARFELHMRCHDCRRVSCFPLDVPDIDDAPRDMDELLESALLSRVRFLCETCESAIGTLTGVRQLELHDQKTEGRPA